MKRTILMSLIVVLCCFVIIGCGTDKEKIKKDFTTMMAATATPEHIRATAKFMDEEMPEVGEESASHMLVAYEKYLQRYITENKDQAQIEVLRSYFDPDTKTLEEEKITDSDVKDYYQHLKAGSVIVVYEEDAPTLKVDYANLLKKYGKYISKPLNRLYELNAETVAKPMAENATLIISWEALLERAYWAENLIKEYPKDNLVNEDAMWLFTTYLNTILMGTTNTPIFDYSTHQFSPEAKEAYTAFMQTNPDDTLTWALKEYFTYLNSIGYKLDYNDKTMSKAFFDTCDWLVSESEKRVLK
jgi:hypothetical protein